MCEKKRDEEMSTFQDFLEQNKAKIQQVTDSNTKRNKKGQPVIDKDDPWRKETEWDSAPKTRGLTSVR